MKTLLVVAIRNVIQGRRRTALLGATIAMVTALFVLLLALSAGIRTSFIRSVGVMTTGHVNVSGFFKPSPSTARAMVVWRNDLRELLERETPGLVRIADRHRAVVKVFSLTDSLRVGVLTGIEVGGEPELFEFLDHALPTEYGASSGDEQRGDFSRLRERPHGAIVFASQADRLGVGVGDVVTVRSDTAEGGANALDLEVVAVARDVGMISRWTIFTTRRAILDLEQLKPTTTGILQLYIEDPDRATEVVDQVREVLTEAGYDLLEHSSGPYYFKFSSVVADDWTGQKLDVTTWRDDVSYLTWILGLLDAISVALIAILLALVSIGIVNTTVMATRERSREFGTLRAIGMRRWQVLLMVLIEAAALGLVATGTGAIVGVMIALGVDALELAIPSAALRDVLLSDVIPMHVEFAHVISSVVLLTLFTVLSAAWPAARAARLHPIRALQQVQ